VPAYKPFGNGRFFTLTGRIPSSSTHPKNAFRGRRGGKGAKGDSWPDLGAPKIGGLQRPHLSKVVRRLVHERERDDEDLLTAGWICRRRRFFLNFFFRCRHHLLWISPVFYGSFVESLGFTTPHQVTPRFLFSVFLDRRDLPFGLVAGAGGIDRVGAKWVILARPPRWFGTSPAADGGGIDEAVASTRALVCAGKCSAMYLRADCTRRLLGGAMGFRGTARACDGKFRVT